MERFPFPCESQRLKILLSLSFSDVHFITHKYLKQAPLPPPRVLLYPPNTRAGIDSKIPFSLPPRLRFPAFSTRLFAPRENCSPFHVHPLRWKNSGRRGTRREEEFFVPTL